MTKLSKYLNPLSSERTIPSFNPNKNQLSYHDIMSSRSKKINIDKREEFKENAKSHKN